MTGISAAGIGSGLDLESLIEVTLDVQRIPLETRLSAKKSTLDVTLSAVGAIKSAMSSFLEVLEKSQNSNEFFPFKGTINGSDASDVGYFDLDIGNDAAAGSYDIEVLQLASGSRTATQNSFDSGSTVIAQNAGELTFSIGSGEDEESFTVETTAGMTLSELREAINKESDNIGVSANLINTGSGTQLVLDTDKAGLDENGLPNNLVVTNSGGADASLDALVGDLTTTKDATEAIITVNGIQATSNSNTYSNVISGVSIDVNKMTDSSQTLIISPDEDAAIKNVESFVSAYNKVISEIDKYSKPGAVLEGEDNERKELSGDAMFRSLKYSMGRMASNGYGDPDDPSRITTFYGLGIEMDNDGMLSLDKDKLKDVLADDPRRFGEVFAGEGGVADTYMDFITSYEESDGVLDSREEMVRASLRDISYEELALKERMADYEKTLRAKYTAFDVTMGQLNSQMSYISGNLGSSGS